MVRERVLPTGGSGVRTFRIVIQNPSLVAGTVILGWLTLAAATADVLAPYSPTDLVGTPLSPPSGRFLLGTDELGRDILSRLLYGARISGVVGLSAVAIALGLGVPLGILAGYYGGWAERLLLWVADVLLAFPGLLLAIAVVAMLGPGLNNTMIAVGVSAIPVYLRTARGAVLGVKHQDYVDAARVLGASDRRLIAAHIFPNILPPVVVLSTVNMGVAILSAAGLSYVGLGAQPPTPEWGVMLSGARGYLRTAWWTAVFPGLAIMAAVLGFNLLGDGLTDLLNPRLRGR